ncbi:MAG: tRNA 2-thiouridine(34) synthase MnmA [Candidatus Omnitrophota bacterium]
MFKRNKNKKVFVAMSGGVDSSVVAAILKSKGYQVFGITMCFDIPLESGSRPSCCGADAVQDAKNVAQTLNIPHHVLSFGQDLNDKVIKYFIDEYRKGRTPNPCVRCNQYIKFGTLLKKVRLLGGDYLATGHYAKIVHRSLRRRFELKKSVQGSKDQSYFLYQIKKEDLPFILFPLGGLVKNQVRALAKKFGLRNAQKKESQDICFVTGGDYKDFLKKKAPEALGSPGLIKDEQGNVLGEHQGLGFYTIGQRDGLGIALGHPVYIYKMEKETNTIYVGPKERLLSRGLLAKEVHFVSRDFPKKPIEVKVKIRYNQPEVRARLIPLKEGKVDVCFHKSQASVTPGQSVVFYRSEVVLGGGIIEKSFENF